MEKKEIKIALVGVSTLMRMAVKTVLKNVPGISIATEATNSKELNSQLTVRTPDIAIIILEHPMQEAYLAIELLRTKCPNTKIVIVLFDNWEEHIIHLLENEVDSIIYKEEDENRLIEIMDKVLTNEYCHNERTFKMVMQKIQNRNNSHSWIDDYEQLDDTNRAIIKYICEGLTAEKMADRLFLSVGAINKRKIIIYDTLNLPHDPKALIAYAIKHGVDK